MCMEWLQLSEVRIILALHIWICSDLSILLQGNCLFPLPALENLKEGMKEDHFN